MLLELLLKTIWDGRLMLRRAVAGVLAMGACVTMAATADFTIVSPQNGAVLNGPVDLRIQVVNAQLGAPRDGLYHLHFSVDGGEAVALYREQDVSLPFKPGKHVIAVELAGPNHRAVGAPKQVSFTVRE